MAVSGPPADRGGVQKPYAIGYACGWNQKWRFRGGTAILPYTKFDIKVWRIFIKLTLKAGFEDGGVRRSCPLKEKLN